MNETGPQAMKSLFAALLLIIPCMAHALDVPALRGRVNDNAGVLTPEAAARIEEKLAGIERTDSTQIVVLTINSLEGEVLEEYSIRVAEAWKIGKKNLDNGVILLIAKEDRKIRIEVGRGLEGKLTDLLSGRIIRNEITPRFRSGDYDGGVEAGIDAIIAVVRGEYAAGDAPDTEKGGGSSLYTALIVLFFVVVMLGGISKILGGVAGAVGLPIVSSLVFSGLGLAGLAALGGVGLVLGIIVSLMFGRGGRGGGFFLGGMGGGGGSFSGGGFSGGGGGFGGGGASGGW